MVLIIPINYMSQIKTHLLLSNSKVVRGGVLRNSASGFEGILTQVRLRVIVGLCVNVKYRLVMKRFRSL